MRTQDLIALLAVVLGGFATPITLQAIAAARDAKRERRQVQRDAQRDELELARQEAQFEESKWADVRAVTEDAAITLNATLRAFDEASARRALERVESIALFERYKAGVYDLWRCQTRLVTRLPRNHDVVQRFAAAASTIERGMLPLSALALARAEAHESGDEFATADSDGYLTREQRATYSATNAYAEEFHDAARVLIGPSLDRATRNAESPAEGM